MELRIEQRDTLRTKRALALAKAGRQARGFAHPRLVSANLSMRDHIAAARMIGHPLLGRKAEDDLLSRGLQGVALRNIDLTLRTRRAALIYWKEVASKDLQRSKVLWNSADQEVRIVAGHLSVAFIQRMVDMPPDWLDRNLVSDILKGSTALGDVQDRGIWSTFRTEPKTSVE